MKLLVHFVKIAMLSHLMAGVKQYWILFKRVLLAFCPLSLSYSKTGLRVVRAHLSFILAASQEVYWK